MTDLQLKSKRALLIHPSPKSRRLIQPFWWGMTLNCAERPPVSFVEVSLSAQCGVNIRVSSPAISRWAWAQDPDHEKLQDVVEFRKKIIWK
jgi:hypothetical protein